MKTDDFDFELPERLIAQTPLKKRDDSKLLILDKETGKIEDKNEIWQVNTDKEYHEEKNGENNE